MDQPTPSAGPSAADLPVPTLGPERAIPPRDLAEGHHVHRTVRTGHGTGWYRVKAVRWLARERRYHVTIEVPGHLRNTLAAYFRLAPQARVTVRTPIEETP